MFLRILEAKSAALDPEMFHVKHFRKTKRASQRLKGPLRSHAQKAHVSDRTMGLPLILALYRNKGQNRIPHSTLSDIIRKADIWNL